MGLEDQQLVEYIDHRRDFLYFDNAYFRRGARSQNVRLIRGATHLQKLLERPPDRLQRLEIEVRPWKQGRNVVVIPPSDRVQKFFRAKDWLDEKLCWIRERSDRPVLVKREKLEPLESYLEDAWCLVDFGSAAAVDALLAGVPVFAGPMSPALPVTAGLDIEYPRLCERGPWLNSLAYATWSLDELERIDLEDYDYSCRDDV